MWVGQQGGKQEYELRIARRDGRRINREPHPVRETFDLDKERERDKVCGRHYVRMAAHAENRRVDSWEPVSAMKRWLPDYQLEVWRLTGSPNHPDHVSMSTDGWRD